jgi:hypothetical protein
MTPTAIPKIDINDMTDKNASRRGVFKYLNPIHVEYESIKSSFVTSRGAFE